MGWASVPVLTFVLLVAEIPSLAPKSRKKHTTKKEVGFKVETEVT